MVHRENSDGSFLLKVLPGEEIVAVLTAFLEARKIHAGSFQAIGAVEEAEVGFWDPALKQYKKVVLHGPLEILSVIGNVARGEDGKAMIHAHIVLGDRDMQARGGHLFRAVAEPTCEIALTPWAGAVDRRLVPAIGLKLLALP